MPTVGLNYIRGEAEDVTGLALGGGGDPRDAEKNGGQQAPV